MNSIEHRIEDAKRNGIAFLITDAGVALTFLDLAKTTSVDADRSRRIEEAHTAYKTILRFLPRLVPTPQEKADLDEKLTLLRQRLLEAGVSLAE